MKKRGCSCNIATTQDKLCSKDHDLSCCLSKLSLKSDLDKQTDFSDKQYSSRKQNHSTKQTNKYKNLDSNLAIEHLRKNYSICFNGEQSVAEAKQY